MSRWARHIDDLAAATVELLLSGPEKLEPLTDPPSALAARDAVLVELRELVGAVSDVARLGEVRELTMFDLVHRPGQALHQALSELPRAAPFGAVQLGGVVDKTLPAYEQAWQRAAHATIGLEGYIDALGRLPDQHSWNVLRDLADLAAALPHLDHDLAEAILPRLNFGQDLSVPYGLLTHPGHDAVRLTAGEIRARVPAFEAAANGISSPTDVVVQHGPASRGVLDEAMTRYIHAVSACGAQLSVGDLRAVTRLLESGSAHAAQVLDRVGSAVAGASDTAEVLRTVSPLARQLREAPSRSMTAEHLNLVRSGNELQSRMKSVAVQARRLPGGAADLDLRRLAVPVLAFVRHVPAVSGALDLSVRDALANGLMLVPSVADRSNTTSFAWVTNTMGPLREGPSAVLAVAGELSITARQLASCVRRADQDLTRHSGSGKPDLAQQALVSARRHAGAARSDLRQVLAQRGAAQPAVLAAALPFHPQLAPPRNSTGLRR